MHVSAMWWLAVPGVLAVLAIGATVGGTQRRRARAYSRDHARHAWYEPEPVEQARQDFYGSMDLTAERALRLPDQDDREQMLAELSPEALDEFYEWANYCTPHCPDDTCRAFGECAWSHDQPSCYPGCPRHDPTDPGPGASVRSLAPGPDLARLSWLDGQLAGHLEWARWMRGQVTGWGLAA